MTRIVNINDKFICITPLIFADKSTGILFRPLARTCDNEPIPPACDESGAIILGNLRITDTVIKIGPGDVGKQFVEIVNWCVNKAEAMAAEVQKENAGTGENEETPPQP